MLAWNQCPIQIFKAGLSLAQSQVDAFVVVWFFVVVFRFRLNSMQELVYRVGMGAKKKCVVCI